jgi:hypothetical protein
MRSPRQPDTEDPPHSHVACDFLDRNSTQSPRAFDVLAVTATERITRAVTKLGFNSRTGPLAYSLGAVPARDVWKMENFLPKNTPSSGGSGARRQ